MRGNLRVFIYLLVAQITVGCTQYHYEYIPPADAEGINCTRRCMDRKWDCSNNCQVNYSDCIESEKKI